MVKHTCRRCLSISESDSSTMALTSLFLFFVFFVFLKWVIRMLVEVHVGIYPEVAFSTSTTCHSQGQFNLFGTAFIVRVHSDWNLLKKLFRYLRLMIHSFNSDTIWLLSSLSSFCSASGAVSVPAIIQCYSRQPGVCHLHLHHLWIPWPRGHMAQVPSAFLIPAIGLWQTAWRRIERENIRL